MKSLSHAEMLAEWEIVTATRKNPSAFSPLYERYYRSIFLFIYRRTENEELASDLTGEVFLKTLLNINKISYKGVPFKAWLFRLASNEVNQYFRKKSKTRIVHIDKGNVERLIKASAEEMHIDYEKYLPILQTELEKLSEQDLQLIELRFFEKVPHAEVAFVLGITENHAKVRLHRILQKLGKRFQALSEKNNGQ